VEVDPGVVMCEEVCSFRGSSTVGSDGEIVGAVGVAGEEADRTAVRHLLATSG
jgi:uncharacterized protein GlcG (DUF336 family)